MSASKDASHDETAPAPACFLAKFHLACRGAGTELAPALLSTEIRPCDARRVRRRGAAAAGASRARPSLAVRLPAARRRSAALQADRDRAASGLRGLALLRGGRSSPPLTVGVPLPVLAAPG